MGTLATMSTYLNIRGQVYCTYSLGVSVQMPATHHAGDVKVVDGCLTPTTKI